MIDPIDNVTLPLPVTTRSPIRLRFASPDRLYDAILMQDLFDDWLVIQICSARTTRSGASKTQLVANFDEGKTLLEKITSGRFKRGYDLIN